ncbi:hypothetical protein KP509_12G030500 [Ceratopteris richardii]|nr:hypothetical protein KP509_12G030500 [Ceratopteris richardii]
MRPRFIKTVQLSYALLHTHTLFLTHLHISTTCQMLSLTHKLCQDDVERFCSLYSLGPQRVFFSVF